MMTKLKHSARIVVNHVDWQRAIRCRIIVQSLFVGAFLLFAAPSYAADKNSTVDHVPCAKLSSVTKDNATPKPAKAMHYRSSAMAISMALGLRSATGPVVYAPKKRAPATMAKASPSKMNNITPSSGEPARSALARAEQTGRCVNVSSLEEVPQRLAMD